MLPSGCSSLTVRPDDDYATHPSATNLFSHALHIKNPSSTKCAASIQSAARLATVLIARACRFTARGSASAGTNSPMRSAATSRHVAATRDIRSLKGIVGKPKQPVTIEDMNSAIEKMGRMP